MSFTKDNHPIFDDLATQFKDEFGYEIFTLVVEEDFDHDEEMIPAGRLPLYAAFATSYNNEWLLYHSPNSNSAERIRPWNPFADARQIDGDTTPSLGDVMSSIVGALRTNVVITTPEDDDDGEGDDPERRSIAEAMEMLARPEGDQNEALDKVMDVIFGPKPHKGGDPKTFYEIDPLDQKEFIQEALTQLKFDHPDDEITPRMMVQRAADLYEASPITMLWPNDTALEMETEESLNQERYVELESIDGDSDSHEADEERTEQQKFDAFWEGQVDNG